MNLRCKTLLTTRFPFVMMMKKKKNQYNYFHTSAFILLSLLLINNMLYSSDSFSIMINHNWKDRVAVPVNNNNNNSLHSLFTKKNRIKIQTSILPYQLKKTMTRTKTTLFVFKEGYKNYGSTHPCSPLPNMPSQTFLDLAHSQFELLSNALLYNSSKLQQQQQHPESTKNNSNNNEESKIKSIALYLPQENANTGQLEFLPSAVYPSHPKSGRVFIASDADSGLPPTVPPTLTQLPGFAHAQTIIPTYPFTNSNSVAAAVGTPEEVLCDRRVGGGGNSNEGAFTALSVPLFSGPQTIGVLLIWGRKGVNYRSSNTSHNNEDCDIDESPWTERDIAQIKRTGETLAMALCMDADRMNNKIRTEEFQVAIADNLHQVKNPVQALRTYTKLLQRNMATGGGVGGVTRDGGVNVMELRRLVDDMVVLSDRLAQNLEPIDAVIDAMEVSKSMNPWSRYLSPSVENENNTKLLYNKRVSSKPTKIEENGVHPKLMPTSSYLVKLSPPQRNVSNDAMTNQDPQGEDKIQIAFVTDILRPIFSVTEAVAKENGIEFCVYGIDDDNELPGVMINPRELQEAVINVLDNAIKYVNLGCDGRWDVVNIQPKIRITLLPNDDSQARGVTIIVEDNGPGVSKEETESIFERGYRGTNARNTSVGSGIGLEYSRNVIEKMKGFMSVVHNDSMDFLKGTVIKFILFGKSNQQR